mmetsp:Transcript_3074/g.11014  ORF Transcript_3074/g.11014 Transcript_3074/m.11014 type:complete len:261 (+) Transcript_3074:506-1288(+)
MRLKVRIWPSKTRNTHHDSVRVSGHRGQYTGGSSPSDAGRYASRFSATSHVSSCPTRIFAASLSAFLGDAASSPSPLLSPSPSPSPSASSCPGFATPTQLSTSSHTPSPSDESLVGSLGHASQASGRPSPSLSAPKRMSCVCGVPSLPHASVAVHVRSRRHSASMRLSENEIEAPPPSHASVAVGDPVAAGLRAASSSEKTVVSSGTLSSEGGSVSTTFTAVVCSPVAPSLQVTLMSYAHVSLTHCSPSPPCSRRAGGYM